MNPCASECDECFEAVFGFFVSRGESAKTLEFAEATLNTIAFFVEIFVVVALYLAVSFGRDDGFGSHGFNMFYDGVGIVSLVGKYGLGFVLAQ